MENNYDIFKLLPPKYNDKLSRLPKSDIEDIIFYLNKYYLELRDRINIKDDITFGLEFEFEEANLSKIKEKLLKNFNEQWKIVEECSVDNGAEITTPILIDDNSTWKSIDKICNILTKHSAILNKAGSHVHIGAQIFEDSKDNILNFVLLWTTYENVICRFLYGEYLNERLTFKKFSKCISKQWYDDYFVLSKMDNFSNIDIIKWLGNCDQFRVVNLTNVISLYEQISLNTIEFKGANGTLNPIIWQNYVNLYIKMINYSKSKKFDRELILNRLYNINNNLSKLNTYRNIFINQALEFCDIIFDNNLDKIYFLKQYLKDMKTTTSKTLVKAKTFTKNKI